MIVFKRPTNGMWKIISKNYKMHREVNLVFGGSGLIGRSFKKILKKKDNYIFLSKNSKNFKKFDLNKSFKNFWEACKKC